MSRPHDAGEREARATAEDRGALVPAHGRKGVQPVQRLASGGQPIPTGFRDRTESRFGADLSAVRVHRDPESAALADAMGARAFTVGADIFMGESEGSPDTNSGRETLRHEIAHTIQQQRDGLRIQRQIVVGGEPWFDLHKVRERYGEEGLETYFKMRDDPGTFEYPNEKALFQEMDLRSAAKDMMLRLEAHGEPFATGPGAGCCRYPRDDEHFKLNELYWDEISKDPPIFNLAKDTRPSAAIRSIFVPGAGTIIDCGMLIVALRYQALLEVLGTLEFDRLFQGDNAPVIAKFHRPTLARGDFHPQATYSYIKSELVPFDPQDPSRNLIPGDQVYFRNHESYEGRLWHGEHSIYIGEGKFIGFGARERDVSEWSAGELMPGELMDDRPSDEMGYVRIAHTYGEMIAKLRAQLPEESKDVEIPGLRFKQEPDMIDVRRPSIPGNSYDPAE